MEATIIICVRCAGRITLEPDRKYIVSVGSVGQPRDYDNRASYTLYDSDKKRFEFKRVEYDIETAAQKVLKARLERNFAHRLFIGVSLSLRPLRVVLWESHRQARRHEPSSSGSLRREAQSSSPSAASREGLRRRRRQRAPVPGGATLRPGC